ncbi:MAG: porin family protein [Gammaproteobacteria bacterium]|nr:porin family protein [Gammaproteobacteria bacterium]
MKKIQTTSLIILLLISGSARTGQWLVGGSLGMAFGNTRSSELNNQLTARGINGVVSGVDDIRKMMQIFAGYEYMPRWRIELAYVDLGDVEASFNGTINGINDYFTSGQDIYPQTATGWQLSSVYRHSVSGRLQLTGRLGIYNWTTDYTLQAATRLQGVSESGTDLSYGIGLETGRWIMAGGIVGQVNLEHYSINDEAINVLAVGVSYRF